MDGFTIPPLPAETPRSDGPEPSWAEGFGAAFAQFRAVDSFGAEGRNLAQARIEWETNFKEVTGEEYGRLVDTATRYGQGFGYEVTVDQAELDRQISAVIDRLPAEKRAKIPPRASINERAREIALEKYYAAEEIRSRATGGQSFGSGFAGGTAAALTDPINLAAMLLTRSPSASILRNVVRESVVSAGVEAIQQPQVQGYRAELGLDAGLDVAAGNVLFAGAGAGVFEGGAQVAQLGYRALARRARAARPGDPAVEDAAGIVEDLADIEEANPFPGEPANDSPAASDAPEAPAHEARLAEAARAAVEGRDPRLDDTSISAAALNGILPDNDAYRAFDPEQLTVAADRFQYKGGGDEFGVLDTLRSVTEWVQERAGIVIAWEAADGTVYLVDGHQRHGLASRVKASDPSQRPRLLAYVMREADGITAEQARVRAAFKNIGEGSGSAFDAAKILRAAFADGVDEDDILPSLPSANRLLTDGRGIAALSDEAFDLVERGILSERAAGAIGREAADRPALHVQMGQALDAMRPASRNEADFMARELARVPQTTEVTADLFGEAEVTRLLIKERATILRAANQQLAKDRRAFDLLVREQDRLEAEGNVLAARNNLERVNANVQTAYRIEKEASRVGPVADALARAAEDLAGGGRQSDLVSRFIRDVRSGDTQGNGGRAEPRGDGPAGGRANEGDAPNPEGVAPARAVEEADPRLRGDERAEAPSRVADIEEASEAMGPRGTDMADAQADIFIEELRTRAANEPNTEFVDPETGEVRPLADLLDELDRDQDAVERLKGCVVAPS